YDTFNPLTSSYEIRYWTIKAAPILNDAEDISYIVFSLTDVTEVINLAENERLAYEAVELQRKQLYSLFMQAPVAIGIFIGPNYIVELANPTLCTLFGRTEDELYGKPIFEVMPESAGVGIEDHLDSVLYTGRPYVGTEQQIPVMRRGKQKIVYFNFVYEPLHEVDGSISGVIAVATDVTEQVHYRHRLEESEHRVNMALEASNLGVWDLDIPKDVITRNSRYDEIFGYKDSNLPWNSEFLMEHIVPMDRERARMAVKKAYLRTGKLNAQARIKWPDGSLHWIHCIGTVYYNEKREPVRMLGTIQDITERKEKERHKDEFISAVSHELKTPVTSLKAFCQVLQRKFVESESPVAAEMLGKMNTQINRLNIVIQDLLDVTRIEGDRLQYRHDTFVFNELMSEIVEEVQRTTDTHTILIQNTDPGIEIYGDRERIGQVLTNLLTNAVKYSPGKDLVIVSLKREKDTMVCSIKDFGIGIPPEKHNSVFERFYRVKENDPSLVSGLGLGLYICHEIIKRQNGMIWLDSSVGKGATFFFSLPL
ncbi:MAG TPA: PAS domain-containing sensor histidine kinase, partial [Sphingobacteriaceae bacterium]